MHTKRKEMKTTHLNAHLKLLTHNLDVLLCRSSLTNFFGPDESSGNQGGHSGHSNHLSPLGRQIGPLKELCTLIMMSTLNLLRFVKASGPRYISSGLGKSKTMAFTTFVPCIYRICFAITMQSQTIRY